MVYSEVIRAVWKWYAAATTFYLLDGSSTFSLLVLRKTMSEARVLAESIPKSHLHRFIFELFKAMPISTPLLDQR